MKRIVLVVLLLVAYAPAGIAATGVGWKELKSFKSLARPLDVAVSGDGTKTFVLTHDGSVQVFTDSGALQGTIPVDKGVDSIRVVNKDRHLILVNSTSAEISRLALEYQYDLDISNAPVRGRAEAPVVIAVFNDFQ